MRVMKRRGGKRKRGREDEDGRLTRNRGKCKREGRCWESSCAFDSTTLLEGGTPLTTRLWSKQQHQHQGPTEHSGRIAGSLMLSLVIVVVFSGQLHRVLAHASQQLNDTRLSTSSRESSTTATRTPEPFLYASTRETVSCRTMAHGLKVRVSLQGNKIPKQGSRTVRSYFT